MIEKNFTENDFNNFKEVVSSAMKTISGNIEATEVLITWYKYFIDKMKKINDTE